MVLAARRKMVAISDLEAPVHAGHAPVDVDLRTSIRPTVAEVDLGAVARNFDRLRRLVAPAQVWAVIKADAYGHGAVPVGRTLAAHGATLAVSLVEEGLELRAADIRAPVVVLGAYYDGRHADVVSENLVPVVYDPAELPHLAAAAAAQHRRLDIHLKVDTGMSRLGIAVDDVPAVLDRIAGLPSLRLAGLCTHFASADAVDTAATGAAIQQFRGCVEVARARGLGPLVNHAANSAAAVRIPASRFDAVRPGLALYGAAAAPRAALPEVEPAMRVTTKIMALRQIPAGTTVSYGGLWRAARPTQVATVPIGYADGYPRHVRGAEVLVRGRRVPVIGAVCMDMMMIDVTDIPGGAAIDDVVVLLGRDGDAAISVDELAGWAGTINYEILCGISKRVPRVYKS